MEEWEYLEGCKDLYKDIMIKYQLPLTSPDGSSKGSPLERCPRPLYSRDSTWEDQDIPQEDQIEDVIKFEVKEDEEEMYMTDDESCNDEEIPPEISTDPGDTRENPRDVKAEEEEEEHVRIKEEEMPIKIRIGEEHHKICHYYQEENQYEYKTQDIEDEEIIVMVDERFKEEEIPTEIRTDGRHGWGNCWKHPIVSPNMGTQDGDITADTSLLNCIHPNRSPVIQSKDLLSDLSTHELRFPEPSNTITHHTDYRRAETLPYSQQCLTQREDLTTHQGGHEVEKRYSCSECGKSFGKRSILSKHLVTHSG
ncbi:hypothetical protein AB205_0115010, partial [Aquarana catesbeiana]